MHLKIKYVSPAEFVAPAWCCGFQRLGCVQQRSFEQLKIQSGQAESSLKHPGLVPTTRVQRIETIVG